MSMYNDNNKKFVAVLNKKIELPKLLNALGHIAVGIVSTAENNSEMEFLKYYDGDGTLHPAISKFPFIVLSADNGNQIRNLRKSAIEQNLLYNDFSDSMLGLSAEEQQENTKAKKEANLDYYAIVLFGDSAILQTLTKKFSLFK